MALSGFGCLFPFPDLLSCFLGLCSGRHEREKSVELFDGFLRFPSLPRGGRATDAEKPADVIR